MLSYRHYKYRGYKYCYCKYEYCLHNYLASTLIQTITKKIGNTLKIRYLPKQSNPLLLLPLLLQLYAPYVFADKNSVSTYITSNSYSNVLPIKQLIDDDWQQAPTKKSSHGFTQTEIGITTYWHNISLTLAHRYDYFLFTNPDTAQAFYLDKSKQDLITDKQYDIALQLYHQRSNGLRLGYQWQRDNFSSEIRLGYWDVSSSRETNVSGFISESASGQLSSVLDLTEMYSSNNLLKRRNKDSWDTDGYGVSADLFVYWKMNEQITFNLSIIDLYSHFKLDNIGLSQGRIDTDGTFINSLGGKAYLPVYRGKETSGSYTFDLPKQINFNSAYRVDNISYIARYKRQGKVDFYNLGAAINSDSGRYSAQLSFDVERLTPELQLKSDWLSFVFAIDDTDLDQAKQLNLDLRLHYLF